MRNLRKLLLLAFVLCWWGGSASPAFAETTCWCDIATAWSDGTYNASQVSLTTNVGKKYKSCLKGRRLHGEQCDDNRVDCSTRCNKACSGYVGSQSFANSLCAKGITNGAVLKCYSHVGTKGWQTNQTIGTLTNIAAVTKTTYDCNGMPGTWLDNPSSGNGGHARCVKSSCNAVSGVPAAPSWVSIGTAWSSATGAAWVTDDKGDVWYGVPAHATTTIVSAAQCHW